MGPIDLARLFSLFYGIDHRWLLLCGVGFDTILYGSWEYVDVQMVRMACQGRISLDLGIRPTSRVSNVIMLSHFVEGRAKASLEILLG
jgi:hypothetical protein